MELLLSIIIYLFSLGNNLGTESERAQNCYRTVPGLFQDCSKTVGKGRRPGVIRRRAGGPLRKRGPPLPPTYIGLL